MECNKDEATRAKSIAETKLEQKDYFRAKKFALKAQALYPGLDGISQMLTTLDVYVSAENKVSGEVDWYGVLGVNPAADNETIKKQYRKLALMLHPDKNNSTGAAGAFKLILDAWSLLSDKAKRLEYNQKRGYKRFQENVQTHSSGPSARPRPCQRNIPTRTGDSKAPSKPSQQKVPRHTGGSSNPSQFFKFASRRTSAAKSQNRSTKVPSTPTSAPSHQRTDTFWTICHRCNMYYEYLKIYCNRTLLCPNCQEPFMALETDPPVKFSRSARPVPWRRRKSSFYNSPSRNTYDPRRNVATAQKPEGGQASPSSFRYANYQEVPHTGAANVGSSDPFTATKTTNVVEQAQDKLKKPHTESNVSVDWEGCFRKGKLSDDNDRDGMTYNSAQGHCDFESAGTSGSRIYGLFDTYHQPNITRELTHLETQKLLIVKAQKEILRKLRESRTENTAMAADKEKHKTKESSKEKYRHYNDSQGYDSDRINELSTTRIAEQAEKRQSSPYADNARKEYPEAVMMDVPDPDFHDFDLERSESSFADNEVWAVYDDDDGMPRLYALISKVISRDPFELRISWLNSKSNSEFSSIGVGSGFYKTCGEFEVGTNETCTSINAFSQRVNWSKSPRGSIVILPQKGDSWAVYRNWSSDWNKNTPDDVVHKYDMVMVLDNYTEERGVSIAPLVKVAGFRTVFLPNSDLNATRRIPKEEIFRFSHRVLNHFLTSQDAPGAPEGSVELDPAAIPLELQQ